MRKTTSGFTLVEVLIVTIVIVILGAITTMAYLAYQSQARQNQAIAMTQSIAAGAESYYLKNGEYPPSYDLIVGSSGFSMTDFSTAATKLKVNASDLGTENWKFTPCAPQLAECSTTIAATETARVFYITRQSSSAASRVMTLAGGATPCTVTFGDTGAPGSTSYAIAFRNPTTTDKWSVRVSNNAPSTTLSAGCEKIIN